MGEVAAGAYRAATVTLKGSELGTGARKLYLVVDANNQVTESNEENNKAYRTVNVGADLLDSAAPAWSMIDYADINGDTFEDLLVTNFSADLESGIVPTADEIAEISGALGDGWTYNGLADWNNDSKLELLFCGSDAALKPQVDEDKKLILGNIA